MDNYTFITISQIIIFEGGDNQFIEEIFGKNSQNIAKNSNAAILASINNVVNSKNLKILDKYFNNKLITYYSNDNLYFEKDFQQNAEELGITSELLNTFTPSRYPEHNLSV